MAALNTWVNDQLHALLGYAERTTVDFVIALGTQA
jgi:hypothetical protein